MSFFRIPPLAHLAALTLLLTACGGGDDSPGTAAPSTGTTATAQQGATK